ncbi:hypothetical protein Tco_0412039 [Tanacetum coccineum]
MPICSRWIGIPRVIPLSQSDQSQRLMTFCLLIWALGTKHLKATLDEPLEGVNFPFNRVILELGKVGEDGE